jgi:hypothetical protein
MAFEKVAKPLPRVMEMAKHSRWRPVPLASATAVFPWCTVSNETNKLALQLNHEEEILIKVILTHLLIY